MRPPMNAIKENTWFFPFSFSRCRNTKNEIWNKVIRYCRGFPTDCGSSPEVRGTTRLSSETSEQSLQQFGDRRLSLFWSLSYQLLTLGWLATIASLLILNFKGYIVGTNADCGVRYCKDDPWWFAELIRSGNYNRDNKDRNIYGALQLVSKTLEAWFLFLSSSLIFDLTMLLSRTGNGLPIGLITLPVEYSTVTVFFSSRPWKSMIQLKAQQRKYIDSGMQTLTRKRTLILTTLSIAGVGITYNLMGPATAVLLLPTITWRELAVPEKTELFTSLAASKPPSSRALRGSCTSTDSLAGNYSCTNKTIDKLFEDQTQMRESTFFFGGASMIVDFFNYAAMPSLQVLEQLYNDLIDWEQGLDHTLYSKADQEPGVTISEQRTLDILSRAREALVHRQGPAFSPVSNCICNTASTTFQISSNKKIRCYHGYPSYTDTAVSAGSFDDTSHYSRCFPVGPAWNGSFAPAEVFVTNSSSSQPVTVHIYSAHKTIYSTHGISGYKAHDCSERQIQTDPTNCDWESIFSDETDSFVPELYIDYVSSDRTANCSCSTELNFHLRTYELDPSRDGSKSTVDWMKVDDGILIRNQSNVHPDWILASLSVNKGEALPGNRTTASHIVKTLGDVSRLCDGASDYTNPCIRILTMHNTIVKNGLSLIDYSTIDNDQSDPQFATAQKLKVSLRLRFWAYGLESRTSKLGAVVAIVGCVIVLIAAAVRLMARTERRDLVQIIATALEQNPPGVLKDLSDKEMRKVRFRMANKKGAEFEFV